MNGNPGTESVIESLKDRLKVRLRDEGRTKDYLRRGVRYKGNCSGKKERMLGMSMSQNHQGGISEGSKKGIVEWYCILIARTRRKMTDRTTRNKLSLSENGT